jgi:DNA-binding GntR family transcriptional regulator
MRVKPETSLRGMAYAEIRRRILDAELPPGSALSEYQVSAQLKISRTPVREALRQLEREGLVVSIPQRGTYVAELSASDVLEIYQVREELEGFAARTAAAHMSAGAAANLEEELERALEAGESDPQLAFEADVKLHKELLRVTQNRRLEQFLGTLDDQVHIIRHLTPSAAGRLKQMTAEHLEIIRAIKAGRSAAAEEAMRQHLRVARDNVLKLLLPSQTPNLPDLRGN